MNVGHVFASIMIPVIHAVDLEMRYLLSAMFSFHHVCFHVAITVLITADACFAQVFLNAQSDFDGAQLDVDPSQIFSVGTCKLQWGT